MPFAHAALAEAQWNPDRDTPVTVDGILAFLGMKEAVARQPEPSRPLRDPGGKPPWLCAPDPDAAAADAVAREGHAE